jgi:hypothetical protein
MAEGYQTDRSLDEVKAALVSAFTIHDYLELRARFPGCDTAAWMVMAATKGFPWAIDFAFQLKDDFKAYGLSVELFLGSCDGDETDIDLFCLSILGALARRESMEKTDPHAVGAGRAIGDPLVNFLSGAILECISFHDLVPPPAFQILIKHRLKLFGSTIKEQRASDERKMIVARFISDNPSADGREIARRTGLNASTISRWMADEDFMNLVRLFSDPRDPTAALRQAASVLENTQISED